MLQPRWFPTQGQFWVMQNFSLQWKKKLRAGCNFWYTILRGCYSEKLNICIYNFSNKDVVVVVLSVKPTAVSFVINIEPNPEWGVNYFFCHRKSNFLELWNMPICKITVSLPLDPREIWEWGTGFGPFLTKITTF